MKKTAEHELPRKAVYAGALAIGVLAGWVNTYLDIDFTPGPALFLWLLAGVVIVVALHEAVHGAAALVFGHRPEFGLKPPLVYITFKDKIPRDHFIVVALAPFILLDLAFAALYRVEALRIFADICFIINTLGAAGDIWISYKLLGAPRGSLIQDTKTGVEVWVEE
jgi:hypothetical protein